MKIIDGEIVEDVKGFIMFLEKKNSRNPIYNLHPKFFHLFYFLRNCFMSNKLK